MKKWLLALLSVGLVLGLSACGGGSDSSSSESSGKNKNGKEEIVMWGSWSGDQIDQLNKQIDTYNKSQDKYEVKYVMQENVEEKLLTSIAGGEVPDLIMWDRYQTPLYASKGVLQPIDELVKKDGINLDDFYEQSVNEMEYDGKLYGLPLLNDCRVLFYNKDLMAEAGIETPPTTWDELATDAQKMTKWDGDKLTQAGMNIQDVGLFNLYLLQAGGTLLNEDGTKTAFNSEQGLEVLNYWDKLQNDLKVYKRGFDDGTDQFAAGNEAMMYNGPWALADYDKVDGLNYGLAQPPTGPSGDKGAIMGGFGLVMPKDAKHQDGAWDFMKWWTTQPENGVEFAKISGWLPANKVAANDEYFTEDPRYSVFVDTMNYAETRPTALGYSDVENLALTPQLEKFMNGDITAEKALSNAEKEGNKILKEAQEGK
ncbi:ABC transporter substrate-binding protein [Listeria costaricensis]|uniref:ABC transporter substrate-binding protein n=1 Tax=Listeria costaricensis TaxID=2026604 RepID=UPI000C085F83|nr:ABC transporter substrate-binding protein [Listeria costaricensis]